MDETGGKTKLRVRPLLWGVMLLAVAVASQALAQDSHEPNPLVGSRLYRSYCFVCHGEDGKSKGVVAVKMDMEPADLTAEAYADKNPEGLAVLIGGYWRNRSSNLPNWGQVLEKDELLDIAAYIPNLGLKNILFTGDTRRGRVLYKRACAACHGRFGNGKGALAGLIDIEMIDFAQADTIARMDDPALIKLIGDGKGAAMPSWEGTLSDSEITDVAAYVRLLSK